MVVLMNKKSEYAIAVIILIALVVAAASMIWENMELGVTAAGIAIVAVLCAIYLIHSDISAMEMQRSYNRGYQDHAKGKKISNTKIPKDNESSYIYGSDESDDYGEGRDASTDSASDENASESEESERSGDEYEASGDNDTTQTDTLNTEKENTYAYSNSENKGTYTYPDPKSKNTTRKPHNVEDEESEEDYIPKEKRPARGKRSHVKGYLRRKAQTSDNPDSNE